MTVTAREVIGIATFGYLFERPYPQLEAVARCASEQGAKHASLTSYREAVERTQGKEALHRFLDTIPAVARN